MASGVVRHTGILLAIVGIIWIDGAELRLIENHGWPPAPVLIPNEAGFLIPSQIWSYRIYYAAWEGVLLACNVVVFRASLG